MQLQHAKNSSRGKLGFLWMLCIALTLIIDLAQAAAGRDFYKILELKRNASQSDIKSAYRSLSRKYHPDKNPGEDAKNKFQEVSDAYEVLSDPDKRRKYDRCGEECVNEGEKNNNNSPFGDIFGSFFGHGHQQEQTGPNMNLKLQVSLEELYTGASFEVFYNRNIICPHCRGSGADDPDDVSECPVCGGSGHIIKKKQLAPGFVQQFQQQCSHCGGEGRIKRSTCHVCSGDALVENLETLNIWVDKGAPNGHQITYRDSADEFVNIRAGSVIVKVIQVEHDRLERKGDDLKMRLNIDLKEALLGFDYHFTHLDGHDVHIDRRNKVTQPGLMERFKGEGMPKFETYGEHGDLLVTYSVKLPDKLTDKQKELIEQFFD